MCNVQKKNCKKFFLFFGTHNKNKQGSTLTWCRDLLFQSWPVIRGLHPNRICAVRVRGGTCQIWALDPPESLDHCDPPPFLSLDPSLKKGLAFWKSWSQSQKRDWHFESLDPSLEIGIGILRVSNPVSKKRSKLWKFWDQYFLKTKFYH